MCFVTLVSRVFFFHHLYTHYCSIQSPTDFYTELLNQLLDCTQNCEKVTSPQRTVPSSVRTGSDCVSRQQ